MYTFPFRFHNLKNCSRPTHWPRQKTGLQQHVFDSGFSEILDNVTLTWRTVPDRLTGLGRRQDYSSTYL